MRPTFRKGLPYLLISFFALLAAGVPAAAESPPDPPSGFHGMLVLGTQDDVYLVHLAMRTNPQHTFQLILRVDFTRGDGTRVGDSRFLDEAQDPETADPNRIYFLDRNHPENDVDVYTFDPGEGFVLTQIPRGERRSFRGDVVRGHFERDVGPPVLLRDVVVSVRDVVFFQDLRELDPSTPHPLTAGKREFLLFGSGEELFLTHRITLHGRQGRPDDNGFHQVLPVRAVTAEGLDLSTRAAAVEVAFTARDFELYPVDGGEFQVEVTGLEADESPRLALEVGLEHYFENLM